MKSLVLHIKKQSKQITSLTSKAYCQFSSKEEHQIIFEYQVQKKGKDYREQLKTSLL